MLRFPTTPSFFLAEEAIPPPLPDDRLLVIVTLIKFTPHLGGGDVDGTAVAAGTIAVGQSQVAKVKGRKGPAR